MGPYVDLLIKIVLIVFPMIYNTSVGSVGTLKSNKFVSRLLTDFQMKLSSSNGHPNLIVTDLVASLLLPLLPVCGHHQSLMILTL